MKFKLHITLYNSVILLSQTNVFMSGKERYNDVHFYPRGASSARVIAVIVCPSVCLCVCLSVCLSHAGIVSKRLNVGSHKQHHVIAQGI